MRNQHFSHTVGGNLRVPVLLLVVFLFLPSFSAQGGEGEIFTLWPIIDYRHSAEVDFTSLNLLGPLVKFERKGPEREFGFRPLYFRAWDKDTSYSEFLYPVASKKSEPGQDFFQGLHLLDYRFGSQEEGKGNEFMLFPFVFYGKSRENEPYFAVFPLGGRILERFYRDEIRFALFPLYSRTRKGDTRVDNLLWPVFARIRGKNESGWKFWPLYGQSQKEGVYRKRFYLWPIVFKSDEGLDTQNPTRRRAVFPFFVAKDSPIYSSRTYLWPFFSHLEDRRKDFEEWNFPWPLFRITHGTRKEGKRFLPFYSDERVGEQRKRWFLWPLYKIEELESEALERRRDRILYFLYSNLEEAVPEEPASRKKRVALWPLFTYERIRGVSHFFTLSLLEPFFPEKSGIERNWAPLWRFYQLKWDQDGNEISSLLWNLYWKERRGADLAVEVFPFFSYRSETKSGTDLTLLKGLFRIRKDDEGRKVNLFYLPWAIPWG